MRLCWKCLHSRKHYYREIFGQTVVRLRGQSGIFWIIAAKYVINSSFCFCSHYIVFILWKLSKKFEVSINQSLRALIGGVSEGFGGCEHSKILFVLFIKVLIKIVLINNNLNDDFVTEFEPLFTAINSNRISDFSHGSDRNGGDHNNHGDQACDYARISHSKHYKTLKKVFNWISLLIRDMTSLLMWKLLPEIDLNWNFRWNTETVTKKLSDYYMKSKRSLIWQQCCDRWYFL